MRIIICTYCYRNGHSINEWYKKQNKDRLNNNNNRINTNSNNNNRNNRTNNNQNNNSLGKILDLDVAHGTRLINQISVDPSEIASTFKLQLKDIKTIKRKLYKM